MQRKLIDAIPMRKGGTALVALIEVLLGTGFLWFMQSWMPFPWYGDILAIIGVAVGGIGLARLSRFGGDDDELETEEPLDVVTSAMRRDDEDEEDANKPDWHQDTLGLEVIPEYDRPISTSSPPQRTVRKMFRSMFSTVGNAALVLSVLGFALAILWLCQKYDASPTLTTVLVAGTTAVAAVLAAFIALPRVWTGGIYTVKPIEGSKAAHKYLVRVQDEKIYYDEVRHWTYFVSQIFSANTLGVALVTAACLYTVLGSQKLTPLYLALVVLALGWRVHYSWTHRMVWNEDRNLQAPSFRRFLMHLFAPLTLALALVFARSVGVLTDSSMPGFVWISLAVVVFGFRIWYCWVKWRYTRLILTDLELAILSTFPFKLRRETPKIKIRALQAAEPYQNIIGEKLNYGQFVADTPSAKDEKFHHLRNITNLHVLEACIKKLSS